MAFGSNVKNAISNLVNGFRYGISYDKENGWTIGNKENDIGKNISTSNFGANNNSTFTDKISDLWDQLQNGQTNNANIEQTNLTNESNEKIAHETNEYNLNQTNSTNAANERIANNTNSINKSIQDSVNASNEKIANENLAYQRENLEYQKALQQQIFDREDTSYQRTVEDMRNAGLSPLTMNGTNGSGSVVDTTALNNNYQAQGYNATGYTSQADKRQAYKLDKANLQYAGAMTCMSMLKDLVSGSVRISSDLENLKQDKLYTKYMDENLMYRNMSQRYDYNQQNYIDNIFGTNKYMNETQKNIAMSYYALTGKNVFGKNNNSHFNTLPTITNDLLSEDVVNQLTKYGETAITTLMKTIGKAFR